MIWNIQQKTEMCSWLCFFTTVNSAQVEFIGTEEIASIYKNINLRGVKTNTKCRKEEIYTFKLSNYST